MEAFKASLATTFRASTGSKREQKESWLFDSALFRQAMEESPEPAEPVSPTAQPAFLKPVKPETDEALVASCPSGYGRG